MYFLELKAYLKSNLTPEKSLDAPSMTEVCFWVWSKVCSLAPITTPFYITAAR